MKSFYKCPACDSPLRVAIDSVMGRHGAWETVVLCTNPRCSSPAARTGERGQTEFDAYNALCATMDAEAEQSETKPNL